MEQAKSRGGATSIATHPWLNVCDAEIYLVHDLSPARELHAGVPVVLRVHDVLPEHGFHVVCGSIPILLHFGVCAESCSSNLA